jgi:hypothetical protein
MRNLHFIRAKTVCAMERLYEELTDVWVFGDINGYRYFIDCIGQAKTTPKNVHFTELDFSLNTMRVVILPSASLPRKAPRLRIVERLINMGTGPQMELVIHGNAGGYDFLIKQVESSIEAADKEPESHSHVGQDTPPLVGRNISLTIRAPLWKWSLDGLGNYRSMVESRGPWYLPPSADAHAWKYREPEPADYPLRAGVPRHP